MWHCDQTGIRYIDSSENRNRIIQKLKWNSDEMDINKKHQKIYLKDNSMKIEKYMRFSMNQKNGIARNKKKITTNYKMQDIIRMKVHHLMKN
jgi:hypothetical protein